MHQKHNGHQNMLLIALYALFILNVPNAAFDYDEFDAIFESAFEDPNVKVLKNRPDHHVYVQTMDFEGLKKHLSDHQVNYDSKNFIDTKAQLHNYTALHMSVLPWWMSLPIENTLTKIYLRSNGRFLASELYEEDAKLMHTSARYFNETLHRILAKKKTRKQIPLHTLHRTWFMQYQSKDLHKMVKILLKHGASVNARDTFNNTVLHLSCFHFVPKIVRTLLKAGANINARNMYGDTPLHIAATSGSYELVKLLVKHGANQNARNKFGQLPYEIAIWYQPNDIDLIESVKPKYNIARKVHRHVQKEKYKTFMDTKQYRSKTNNFHAVVHAISQSWAPYTTTHDANNEVIEALGSYGIDLSVSDIPREYDIDWDTFKEKYVHPGRPVIIARWKGTRGKNNDSWDLLPEEIEELNLFKMENVISMYGDLNVSVGGIPYASETNPSLKKPNMKLKTYIEAVTKNNVASKLLDVNETEEIESYLFDSEVLNHMRKLNNALAPLRRYNHRYRDLHYGSRTVGQLIIGKKKVGAPIHFHAPGMSYNLVGRKHWIMFPPHKSFYTNIAMWPFLKKKHYEKHFRDALHFTQHPGEIVFVPACWGHGTIIIDDVSLSIAENLDPLYTDDAEIL